MTKKYIPSFKEIAERSGVSISTVSRVMQKKSVISQETSEKVLAVAEELGYHPNKLIEGMQTGKTKTIGVVLDVEHSFLREMVKVIHDQLIAKDYLPITIWPGKSSEKELIRRLVEQRVEGIIIRPICDWATDSYFEEVINLGLPIISVDRKLPANIDFVGTDDFLGGKLSAEYLLELGHRKIAYYQGPLLTSPARLRKEGFESALESHPDAELRLCGDGSWQSKGPDLVTQFLTDNRDITAVAAFNDEYAQHVYEAARELGINIPDSLSVIGFGCLDFGNYMNPKLTTMGQLPERIAQELLNGLFIRKDKTMDEVPIINKKVKPELIVRDSAKSINEEKES